MKRLVLVIIAIPLFINAQEGWVRNYGWEDVDVGLCVKETIDNNYIVVGYTRSFGRGEDLCLLEVDSKGDTLWTRVYGDGEDHSTEKGWWIEQTTDDGYMITGQPWTLLKTNEFGDTLWSRSYGGEGHCIQQTSDGGYVITGTDYTVLKTDEYGDYLWSTVEDMVGWSVRQHSMAVI